MIQNNRRFQCTDTDYCCVVFCECVCYCYCLYFITGVYTFIFLFNTHHITSHHITTSRCTECIFFLRREIRLIVSSFPFLLLVKSMQWLIKMVDRCVWCLHFVCLVSWKKGNCSQFCLLICSWAFDNWDLCVYIYIWNGFKGPMLGETVKEN